MPSQPLLIQLIPNLLAAIKFATRTERYADGGVFFRPRDSRDRFFSDTCAGAKVLLAINTLKREVLPTGKAVISGQGTTLTFQRPTFNLMQIELSGREDAALSQVFFDLLAKELAFDQRHAPRIPTPPGIEMFVDAQRVSRHGLMFEAWIQFLLAHRHQLHHIHILATNRVAQLSVEIMQHLSDTASLVRLYSLPCSYTAALHAVVPPSRSPIRHLHKTIDRLNNYLQHVPQNKIVDGQREQ